MYKKKRSDSADMTLTFRSLRLTLRGSDADLRKRPKKNKTPRRRKRQNSRRKKKHNQSLPIPPSERVPSMTRWPVFARTPFSEYSGHTADVLDVSWSKGDINGGVTVGSV